MSARATFAVLAREADFLEGSGKTDVERMRPGGPNEVYLVRVRLRGPAAGGGGRSSRCAPYLSYLSTGGSGSAAETLAGPRCSDV